MTEVQNMKHVSNCRFGGKFVDRIGKVVTVLFFNWHHTKKAYWGSVGIAPRILWPQHEMVCGQLHAPAALPPWKESLLPIG